MTIPNSNFATTDPECVWCHGAVLTPGDRVCAECRDAREVTRRAGILTSYIRSGFPAHVLSALANDAPPTADRSAARSKIATLLSGGGDAFSVYLHGVNGCGKTFEACRAGLTVIAAGGRATFSTTLEFIARITSSYNRGADEHTDDVLQDLATAALLVLDDLGAERATEHAVGRLFELIDARYSAQRPTIFTSNYPLPNLLNHLAGSKDDLQARRLADRLREMCTAAPIAGASFRATERPLEWQKVRRVLNDIARDETPAFRFSKPHGDRPSVTDLQREAAALLPAWIDQAAATVDLRIFGSEATRMRPTNGQFDRTRPVV